MKTQSIAQVCKDVIQDKEWYCKHVNNFLDYCAPRNVGELNSDTAISIGRWSAIFTVYNRDDLKELMKLAPLWKKGKTWDGRAFFYGATIGLPLVENPDNDLKVNYDLRIYPENDALPPTCKTVEIEEYVPPTEGHTVKKTVIVCNGADPLGVDDSG